jgi:hypothetical protein
MTLGHTMNEDYKIVPDERGAGAEYFSALAGPRIIMWSLIAFLLVGLVASLIYHWSIVISVSFALLLIGAGWKTARIPDPVCPPCPKCGTITYVIKKKKVGSDDRTILFACHRCRVAIDSGVIESLSG